MVMAFGKARLRIADCPLNRLATSMVCPLFEKRANLELLRLIGKLSYGNDTKGFELNGCIGAARPAHRCDIILSSAGRRSLIRTQGPLSYFFLTVTTFPFSPLMGKQLSA